VGIDDANIQAPTITDVHRTVTDADRTWSHNPLLAEQIHLAGVKTVYGRDLVSDPSITATTPNLPAGTHTRVARRSS
jgi:hypothetical protein